MVTVSSVEGLGTAAVYGYLTAPPTASTGLEGWKIGLIVAFSILFAILVGAGVLLLLVRQGVVANPLRKNRWKRESGQAPSEQQLTPPVPDRGSVYHQGHAKVKFCRAKFDFIPKDEGEVGFSAGDIIRIIDESDPHWWEGEVNGRVGIFPGAYTEEK